MTGKLLNRMNFRSPLRSLESMNTPLFFALIFIYLIIFSFQGLDFLDEGFIVTFYQQIFKAPETVEYSFMFWFSGVVGGVFYRLFPDMGLWGFRLLGAITVTLTLFCSYRLLKRYVDRGYLKVGILLTLLIFSNNVKSFHYNILSSFFYVITATLLFAGLKKKQYWQILLAGGCIAFDSFSRIPSVVNIGLVSAIVYHGFINSIPFKTQLRQAFVFLAGFAMAFFAIIVFMKLIGQYEYFVTAMHHISEMGSGGEGSDYGIFKLIKGFIKNYGLAVIISGFTIAILALILFILQKTGKKQLISVLFPLLIITIGAVLISKGILSHNKLVLLYTGTILLTGAAILWSSRDKDLKSLTFIAGFTLLAYPLGSSDSLNTVGIYSLWLALPIAINYLLSLKPGLLQNTGKWRIDTSKFFYVPGSLKTAKSTVLIVCIAASLYYAYYYPLFDNHERLTMRFQPETDRLKYIYTTQDKAEGVTNFLNELNKYVSPEDEILAYPSIAMVHFMTRTNPYMHNPAPWLYEAEYFRKQLDLLYQEKKKLPVVVSTPAIKNELTAYHGGKLESISVWDKRNLNRTLYFESFLQKHGYREQWSNSLFIIYLPPALH